MVCLIQFLAQTGSDQEESDMNAAMAINNKMKEIMQPDSKYMRKINVKIQRMMQPDSIYMMEINKRLGQLPGLLDCLIRQLI